MWLAAPDGSTLLIAIARADQECDVARETGEEEDCEVVVGLRSGLSHAPLNLTTLEGLTLEIREHAIGLQAIAPVLMTGTVTAADLNLS